MLKIEFQGGEPLLNFPLIKEIVLKAEEMNASQGKDLAFVIATNLALLDDEVLDFCAAHNIYISTSLDGPADLHNKNRPRPGHDSWERTVDGIKRVRETLGEHRVSALMTTTRGSLDRAREIIDCYLDQGLTDVFLRPLSPYGFAIKTRAYSAYDAERWLDFYSDGLDYILELNAQGVDIREVYASIILKKMLTNLDPGYVDLTSPSGIGIGAVVYNYDGDVYASDEGRMLAEMRDTTFRLGNLHADSYEEIMLSEALLKPLEESFALSAPMCNDCASSHSAAPTPLTTTRPAVTLLAASQCRISAAGTCDLQEAARQVRVGSPCQEGLLGVGRAMIPSGAGEFVEVDQPLERTVWRLDDRETATEIATAGPTSWKERGRAEGYGLYLSRTVAHRMANRQSDCRRS